MGSLESMLASEDADGSWCLAGYRAQMGSPLGSIEAEMSVLDASVPVEPRAKPPHVGVTELADAYGSSRSPLASSATGMSSVDSSVPTERFSKLCMTGFNPRVSSCKPRLPSPKIEKVPVQDGHVQLSPPSQRSPASPGPPSDPAELSECGNSASCSTTVPSDGDLLSWVPGEIGEEESLKGSPARFALVTGSDGHAFKPLGGTTLRICELDLRVTDHLFQGSFGDVWAAQCPNSNGTEIAIKEIMCRSPAQHGAARREAELLSRLVGARSENMSDDDVMEVSRRIPRFLATETRPAGPDAARVLIAMTRLPGEPLETFLEARRAHARSDAAASGHQSSPSRRCADACLFVEVFLKQLASVMELVSMHEYHRDIQGRNILVDQCNPDKMPSFGLVDFGFAVDASSWEESGWKDELVVGDCRFWPVSAWLMFEQGVKEVARCQCLSEEYKHRLDFHSVGLTALQALMQVSAPLAGHTDRVDLEDEEEYIAWELLWDAWQRYWEDATYFSERVYSVFANGGSFDELRQEFSRFGVHRTVGMRLKALHTAIRVVRDTCKSATVRMTNAPVIMDALLGLISCGGSTDTLGATSWLSLRKSLTETLGRQSGPRAPGSHRHAPMSPSHRSPEECSL